MTSKTTQKQEDKKGLGPLLALLVLFADADAVAELFRRVRWINGLVCPNCPKRNTNVTRYCKYKGNIQRYKCKDCHITFNDKTGTILHYKRISMGKWMLSVWMYLCGPLNGISINYISEAIGHTYKTTYYMIRAMMDQIQSLQEKVLSGDCETDEMYKKAASKGVRLETNGEDRTLPSRRALPRGPGRGTFEKNTPMITLYHQRATKDDHDWTIFDVPRAGKSLMEMVQNRIKKGSKVMTDEHPGYKKLGGVGYDHATVNHSEGEYASGPDNEIHSNNCECRAGLLRWWMSKHRGVSKWHLESYVKAFQFVHNHRHHSIEGRFMVTLAALLEPTGQQPATAA